MTPKYISQSEHTSSHIIFNIITSSNLLVLQVNNFHALSSSFNPYPANVENMVSS